MTLKDILEDLLAGRISLEDAEKRVKLFEMEKLSDEICLDITRDVRTGIPEVVYGENKDYQEIKRITYRFLERTGRCIITRMKPEYIDLLTEDFKDYRLELYKEGRIAVIKKQDFVVELNGGVVAVLCGGTSDVRVAEEARIVAEEMGCRTLKFYDVGVAGFHRLVPAVKRIVEEDVDVAIVAAGMEGALPSVVAGLVDIPIVGVPVSVGYGAGSGGIAALYSMLQSCSPGLVTVNIDNGFGAGVAAAKIAGRVARFRKRDSC
jgi:hypothetical protein